MFYNALGAIFARKQEKNMQFKKSQLQTVTAARAKSLLSSLDNAPMQVNRARSKTKINQYAELMNTSQRPFKDTLIEICTYQGAEFVTEGQHRLAAQTVINMPEDYIVQEFECNTLDEVKSRFFKHDSGYIRTHGHMYEVQGIWSQYGISKSFYAKACAAIKLISNNMLDYSQRKIPLAELQMMFDDWAEEIALLESIVKNCANTGCDAVMKERIVNAPTMAGLLPILKWQPIRGREFIERLLTRQGEVDSPEYKLANFINQYKSRDLNPSIHAENISRRWNEFFDGVKKAGNTVGTGNGRKRVFFTQRHYKGTPFVDSKSVVYDVVRQGVLMSRVDDFTNGWLREWDDRLGDGKTK